LPVQEHRCRHHRNDRSPPHPLAGGGNDTRLNLAAIPMNFGVASLRSNAAVNFAMRRLPKMHNESGRDTDCSRICFAIASRIRPTRGPNERGQNEKGSEQKPAPREANKTDSTSSGFRQVGWVGCEGGADHDCSWLESTVCRPSKTATRIESFSTFHD